MEQMVKCANCGTPNPPGQQFCGSCGARLVSVVHQAPAVPSQQTPSAVQQAPAASNQQVSTMPAQEVTTVPPLQVPARATKPAIPRQEVDTKPTWGLAWGLWWKMVVLSILIFGVIYAVVVMVMVLAFNYQLPFLSGG